MLDVADYGLPDFAFDAFMAENAKDGDFDLDEKVIDGLIAGADSSDEDEKMIADLLTGERCDVDDMPGGPVSGWSRLPGTTSGGYMGGHHIRPHGGGKQQRSPKSVCGAEADRWSNVLLVEEDFAYTHPQHTNERNVKMVSSASVEQMWLDGVAEASRIAPTRMLPAYRGVHVAGTSAIEIMQPYNFMRAPVPRPTAPPPRRKKKKKRKVGFRPRQFVFDRKMGVQEAILWRANRAAALARFHAKKEARKRNPHLFAYKIRKNIANKRPRIKGRFVKTTSLVNAAAVAKADADAGVTSIVAVKAEPGGVCDGMPVTVAAVVT